MLEFKNVELADIPIFKKYLYDYQSKSCDLAVLSLMMWREWYQNSYAIYDDTLILSSYYENERSFYYPIGKNPEEAVRLVRDYCIENAIPLVFFRVESADKDKILKLFPKCSITQDRDISDYIYDAKSVTELTGKAYSQKRNQIHKFEKNYDDFEFLKIDDSNINDVIEFNKNFVFGAEKPDNSADFELKACTEYLENYKLFDLPGYLLRIDGKIEGYTVGEVIGDTLFIQIEKANTEFRGIYQMLFYLFLDKIVNENVKFVNREDDSGDPGLRKSKLSYNPLYLLDKYKIVCK